MDERRTFFRINNKGEILAKIANLSFEVIDISASGVRLTNNSLLPKQGVIEISINRFSINISYKILRVEKQTTILNFTNDDEIDRLFIALKQLRDERRTRTPHH
ncbi:PilZ domain-containing protein [Legionella bononiensis]|uniref:PilZ domain-containing protein n=1 Tax=Legionella bononiensis TaxID=2793102 RepID=A0ABS1W9D4_9GAMM|nr:PilZ domain-containing protein [Legionella bononiensis]MBL7480845.1 PilZ domain-containing protein [Legionella bononiensis]MBL7525973.1 PilZ domain-containing protein [Legionella bononiensis]MBL7563960.1 PilZ domain-containing protein [Legionella bononiensis]